MKYLSPAFFSHFEGKYSAFLKVNSFIIERKFGSKSLSESTIIPRNLHRVKVEGSLF